MLVFLRRTQPYTVLQLQTNVPQERNADEESYAPLERIATRRLPQIPRTGYAISSQPMSSSN